MEEEISQHNPNEMWWNLYFPVSYLPEMDPIFKQLAQLIIEMHHQQNPDNSQNTDNQTNPQSPIIRLKNMYHRLSYFGSPNQSPESILFSEPVILNFEIERTLSCPPKDPNVSFDLYFLSNHMGVLLDD